MKKPALALLATLALPLAARAEVRTFTSTDGRTLRASLVAVDGDKVTIQLPDGRKITAAADRFSAADRQYFAAWKPAVAGAAAAASGASDWFQWRGPNRDGSSTESGLNRDWESKPPELLWHVKGLGGGMSSVVIHGGKIFTMGKVDGAPHLICRNLADGAEVWATEVPGGDDPNCTPTVDPSSGLVFGMTKDGHLSAARVADGELVWSTSFGDDFGGKMESGWGYSESPLIDGDHLICTPGARDGLLAALDKMTGEPVWKTDVSDAELGDKGNFGAGYSSPVISNAGGVKQVVQLTGKGLVGVDAADGKLLWNYNRIANGTANIPTPIISGDYVFGSTGYADGGSALLKLSKRGSGIEAEEVYYYKGRELQNHHGGMILVDGHIYLGHGHNNGFPQCVELESGDIKWPGDRGPGRESAAIAYADGLLFFRYQDHTMALIEADPDQYTVKGHFKLATSNANSWPHPVIQGGKMYIRDQDDLMCYDVGG